MGQDLIQVEYGGRKSNYDRKKKKKTEIPGSKNRFLNTRLVPDPKSGRVGRVFGSENRVVTGSGFPNNRSLFESK